MWVDRPRVEILILLIQCFSSGSHDHTRGVFTLGQRGGIGGVSSREGVYCCKYRNPETSVVDLGRCGEVLEVCSERQTSCVNDEV